MTSVSGKGRLDCAVHKRRATGRGPGFVGVSRPMSDLDFDVIIAGAGIAGATLALALDQAGLKPVLIDPVVFDAQVAPTFDGRERHAAGDQGNQALP